MGDGRKRRVNFFNTVIFLLILSTFAFIVNALVLTTTLEFPADGQGIFDRSTVDFNMSYTTSGGSLLENFTLWTNLSGSFAGNVTRSDTANFVAGGRPHNISLQLAGEHIILYAFRLNFSTGEQNLTGNRTVWFDRQAPAAFQNLNVSVGSSILGNNTATQNQTPTFNWTATRDLTFRNYTLAIYNSTTMSRANLVFNASTTNISRTVFSLTAFGANLSQDSRYYVNITAYDNYSSTSATVTGGQILEFVVDTVGPNLELEYPLNATWFTGTRGPVFNITLNESNPSSCNVFMTGGDSTTFKLNFTNSSGLTNGQNELRTTLTSIFTDTRHDRGYLWDVNCTDLAGVSVWSDNGNYTFYIDQNPPAAFNHGNRTANASVLTDRSPAFNWTASSDTNFANYTFLIYNDSNFLPAVLHFSTVLGNNASTIKPGDPTNRSVNLSTYGLTLADGTYYWQVLAFDLRYTNRTATTEAATRFFQFNIDTTDPTLTLSYPLNNTWLTRGHATFNVTLTEANPDACRLFLSDQTGSGSSYVHNSTNKTGLVNGQNELLYLHINNNANLTDTKIGQGYRWTVLCNDTAGTNVYASNGNFTLLIDANAPAAFNLANGTVGTETHVRNGSVTSDTAPFFNWTASSDTNFVNYTFSLFNATAFSPANLHFRAAIGQNVTGGNGGEASNVSIDLTDYSRTLDDGTYYWQVQAYDPRNAPVNATGDGVTGFNQLQVDNTNPSVALIGVNGTVYAQRTRLWINATVSDTNLFACSAFLSDLNRGNFAINTTNTSLSTPSTITHNVSGLADGTYNFNYRCNDTADNTVFNTTLNLTFIVDTTAPTAPILVNGSVNVTTDTTPELNWSRSTELHFNNYTIQIANSTDFRPGNIVYNGTETSNTQLNHTVAQVLTNGVQYYWRVIAYDLADKNATSDVGILEVDNANPVVTLITPRSEAYSTAPTQSFNFTVLDNNTQACDLYTDLNHTWQAWRSNISINGADRTRSIQFLSVLVHNTSKSNWNVLCNDSLGNSAYATNNFTLRIDDSAPRVNSAFNITNLSRASSRIWSFNITDRPFDGNESGVNITTLNVSLIGGSTFNATKDCRALGTGWTCTYEETNFVAGQNRVNVSARDNASNLVNEQYIFDLGGNSSTITLNPGWNLVTTPLILTNNTFDSVVDGNTNIPFVYFYNDSTASWVVWRRDGSDTLTQMEPRRGYWMNATGITTLTLSGSYTQATGGGGVDPANAVSLSVGWNLIGHYSTNGSSGLHTNDQLDEMCSGLCSTGSQSFDGLFYFNSVSQELVTAQTSSMATDGIWTTGRGFWIYMNAADTYGP